MCRIERWTYQAFPHMYPTDGKLLTSPQINLAIDPVMAILAPNVLARGQVLEFRAAATREWEAARREWEEQATGPSHKAERRKTTDESAR